MRQVLSGGRAGQRIIGPAVHVAHHVNSHVTTVGRTGRKIETGQTHGIVLSYEV